MNYVRLAVFLLFVTSAPLIAADEILGGMRNGREQSHRVFQFWYDFVDEVRAWLLHQHSDADHEDSSFDNTNSGGGGQSLDPHEVHNDTFEEKGKQTVHNESSGVLSVPLEPQELKDAGKIATIVGGTDASPESALYFVMILTYNQGKKKWEFNGCGGTLVSDRHVLTAGHCAFGSDPNNDAAYVGAYQPFDSNIGHPYFFSKIASYTIHPDFQDGPNKSDVAIATLQSPIDLNVFKNMRVGSADIAVHDGDMVTVLGFGRKQFSDTTQTRTLQQVQMPFISQSACREFYGGVLDDMVCTGYREGGKDACSGDSGGPMLIVANGVLSQIGIVSWGDGCAIAGKPGVYASVQLYYSWIQRVVCDTSEVKVASDLCVYSQADYGDNIVPSPSQTIASKPVAPCVENGNRCSYGGQCCSGTCKALSSSQRVCAALASRVDESASAVLENLFRPASEAPVSRRSRKHVRNGSKDTGDDR